MFVMRQITFLSFPVNITEYKGCEMIRKIFKVLLIVVGALALLFGLFGGIKELSSDKADTAGLILAPVFIILGSVFLYLGIRKKQATVPQTSLLETTVPPKAIVPLNQEKPETTEERLPEQTSDVSTWQRKFLIVSGSIELFLMILTIVLAAIIGITGFIAGEMGTMVGILMLAAAIGVAAALSMRIVALWGLIKKARWAPIVNLILIVGLTVLAISSMIWPIIPYFGFAGWCSIFLIKHPSG